MTRFHNKNWGQRGPGNYYAHQETKVLKSLDRAIKYITKHTQRVVDPSLVPKARYGNQVHMIEMVRVTR